MADAASSAQLDEQRIARIVTLGLPAATVLGALVVGVLYGPATGLLVVAAGMLLGVIALLWGSLRILSGDAPLSADLEELDLAARGEDPLTARKTMLLRALKDLENEHGIGKIEDDDFDQLSAVYRSELKGVLRRIDEALAPHRDRAEALALEHLARAGIANGAAAPAEGRRPARKGSSSSRPTRVSCSKCAASNEPDAKFCKECATPLSPTSGEAEAAAEEPAKEIVDE